MARKLSPRLVDTSAPPTIRSRCSPSEVESTGQPVRGAMRWALVVACGLVTQAAAAENLVTNGSFATGLSGWAVGEGNTVVTWSSLDAAGSAGSGSVRLENPAIGAAPRGVDQCIAVGSGASVRIGARFFLEGGGEGYASLNALQFHSSDCSGPPNFLPEARADGFAAGSWNELLSTPTLGSEFHSIILRLTAVGNGRAAHFDDLAVEVEGDEPVGPPPPFASWISSGALPGFQAQVRITGGSMSFQGQGVSPCIVESICIQGALAGRPELFLKVIGPRPNGYLWVQVSRFTPSEVELWVRRTGSGQINYYRLAAVALTDDDVSGLQDRTAFSP